MKQFLRFIEGITVITGHICGWVVFSMMLLVLYEASMRYLFHRSPMLADEFASYMFVFLSFIGLAYTWRDKGHVRITNIIDILPQKVAHRLRLSMLVLAFACSVLLTKFSYDFLIITHKMHIRSSSWLTVPQEWPRGLLFVGFLLLTLQLIVEFIKISRSPEQR